MCPCYFRRKLTIESFVRHYGVQKDMNSKANATINTAPNVSENQTTCDPKPECNAPPNSPPVKIRTECRSRTVEYKDGKCIETCTGVKRINDDWFTLADDGSWTSSTKEIALEGKHGTVKEIEEPKKPSQLRNREFDESYFLPRCNPFVYFPVFPQLLYRPSISALLDW